MERKLPGVEPDLSETLKMAGQDPGRVISFASSEVVERRYAKATDEDRTLSIFGAPSFVVGREVFWGDDRLEDAIAWASQSGA